MHNAKWLRTEPLWMAGGRAGSLRPFMPLCLACTVCVDHLGRAGCWSSIAMAHVHSPQWRRHTRRINKPNPIGLHIGADDLLKFDLPCQGRVMWAPCGHQLVPTEHFDFCMPSERRSVGGSNPWARAGEDALRSNERERNGSSRI